MKYDEKLVKKLVDIYNRSEHRVNVLEFASMDENAHTKFLKAILCHERNGKQVFVQSFLKRMLDQEIYDSVFEIQEQVSIEGGRILDLLLKSPNLYVVIENKVRCAKDGDRQMADYLQHCKVAAKKSHRQPRIVYLTLAGGVPAQWSLDKSEHEQVMNENLYFERSYRDEILGWLREDVLPNCLYIEHSLFHSVSIYVDAMTRKAGGGNVDEIMAHKAQVMLGELGVTKYEDVNNLCNDIGSWMESKIFEDEITEISCAQEVVTNLRDWLLCKCVYLDSWYAADNLKWLLRNNPTLQYKNRGQFEVGVFKSIGRHTWYEMPYIELVTNVNECGARVRIHINCTMDGIRQGPYVFLDEMRDVGVSDKALEKAGLQPSENNENAYCFPMLGFDQDTGLENVARHIENLIRKLENLTPKLRCK